MITTCTSSVCEVPLLSNVNFRRISISRALSHQSHVIVVIRNTYFPRVDKLTYMCVYSTNESENTCRTTQQGCNFLQPKKVTYQNDSGGRVSCGPTDSSSPHNTPHPFPSLFSPFSCHPHQKNTLDGNSLLSTVYPYQRIPPRSPSVGITLVNSCL